MKIVIYILFIAMPDIGYNIVTKNLHLIQKINTNKTNEGKDVQGENVIFH